MHEVVVAVVVMVVVRIAVHIAAAAEQTAVRAVLASIGRHCGVVSRIDSVSA